MSKRVVIEQPNAITRPDPLDDFMTRDQLREFLGLRTQQMIVQFERLKSLPVIKCGAARFYDRVAVSAWLRSLEVNGREPRRSSRIYARGYTRPRKTA